MPSNAIFGLGTLLKIGDGGDPEAFTTIAEVRSIEGPGGEMDIVDVTSHDSSSGYRDKLAGLLDGGQVTFEVNFQPDHATHGATSGLWKDHYDKTLRNFELVAPNAAGSKFEFSAFVRNLPPSFPHDSQVTAQITLEVSGKPNLVEAP